MVSVHWWLLSSVAAVHYDCWPWCSLYGLRRARLGAQHMVPTEIPWTRQSKPFTEPVLRDLHQDSREKLMKLDPSKKQDLCDEKERSPMKLRIKRGALGE